MYVRVSVGNVRRPDSRRIPIWRERGDTTCRTEETQPMRNSRKEPGSSSELCSRLVCCAYPRRTRPPKKGSGHARQLRPHQTWLCTCRQYPASLGPAQPRRHPRVVIPTASTRERSSTTGLRSPRSRIDTAGGSFSVRRRRKFRTRPRRCWIRSRERFCVHPFPRLPAHQTAVTTWACAGLRHRHNDRR